MISDHSMSSLWKFANTDTSIVQYCMNSEGQQKTTWLVHPLNSGGFTISVLRVMCIKHWLHVFIEYHGFGSGYNMLLFVREHYAFSPIQHRIVPCTSVAILGCLQLFAALEGSLFGWHCILWTLGALQWCQQRWFPIGGLGFGLGPIDLPSALGRTCTGYSGCILWCT